MKTKLLKPNIQKNLKIMSTTPYTDAIISIPIRCEGPKVYTMAGRTITIHEVFL